MTESQLLPALPKGILSLVFYTAQAQLTKIQNSEENTRKQNTIDSN